MYVGLGKNIRGNMFDMMERILILHFEDYYKNMSLL